MKQKTKYGTNEPGKPYFSNGGCWRRLDVWTSDRTGEVSHELHFAAGPDDSSPVIDHSLQGEYNPECSCCWLNFSHTVEAHKARLATAA